MTAGPRRCTAIRANKMQCRKWAVPGTEPALCSIHGGSEGPQGFQPGNRINVTHGKYVGRRERRAEQKAAREIAESEGRQAPGLEPERLARFMDEDGFPNLDSVVEDVLQKQAILSRFIDEHMLALSPAVVTRLVRIYDRTVASLTSLLKERAAQDEMAQGTLFDPELIAHFDEVWAETEEKEASEGSADEAPECCDVAAFRH